MCLPDFGCLELRNKEAIPKSASAGKNLVPEFTGGCLVSEHITGILAFGSTALPGTRIHEGKLGASIHGKLHGSLYSSSPFRAFLKQRHLYMYYMSFEEYCG